MTTIFFIEKKLKVSMYGSLNKIIVLLIGISLRELLSIVQKLYSLNAKM